MWLYWAIRREMEHRRDTRSAMREMRRNHYVAAWHDLLPQNRRKSWKMI